MYLIKNVYHKALLLYSMKCDNSTRALSDVLIVTGLTSCVVCIVMSWLLW